MPIFGADHTEPEGSNFARSAEDFAILRKAVKEIDVEFKKSFKYFKGMAKPMEEVCVAVNHFYDGPHTTTEFRTRGSRLTNMVARITVAIESYDSEYGTLIQMMAAYGEKLKSAKSLIDDRLDKLAEYNAKKKSFASMQSKEGKDPSKVKAAQDKFQTAKDAFDAADAKAQKELADIFVQACGEFEECYSKYLRIQSALLSTAGASLGGADLPTNTTQFSVIGTDDSISKIYKGEQKELEKEKKRDKKEEKRDKKEDKRRTRRGTISGISPSRRSPSQSRNDVFEPSPDRRESDDEVPPPSLSTPPTIAYTPPNNRSSLAIHSGSLTSITGSNPPPLPAGRPAPPPDIPTDSPPVLFTRHSSSDIMTDLELIGREPKPETSQKSLPPLPPSNASAPPLVPPSMPPSMPPSLPPSNPPSTNAGGPPPLPAGRVQPNSVNVGTAPALPSGRKTEVRSPSPPRRVPPLDSSNGEINGTPPTLPPGRPMPASPRESSASLNTSTGNANGPPPLPSGRTPLSPIQKHDSARIETAPPRLPPSVAGNTSSGAPPPLPSGRYSAAPGSIQPINPSANGAAPPLPVSRGAPALVMLPLTPDSPHVGGAAPSLPSRANQSGPPVLPSRAADPPASTTPKTSTVTPLSPELPRRQHATSSAPTATASGSHPPALPPTSTQPAFNPRHSLPSFNAAPAASASSSENDDAFNPRAAAPAQPSVIIPNEEISKYGLIFMREDANNSGYIGGQQAFGLFTRSKLPTAELAQIWEISDQDKDGKLTKDEFIVAMWYINSRLRQQIDAVPKEPHPSLRLSNYPNRALPSS